MDKQTPIRLLLFLSATVIIGVLTAFPLIGLLGAKSKGMFYEYYSHILLIPLVSGYLLFRSRGKIRALINPAIPLGILIGILGVTGYAAGLIKGQNLTLVDLAAWEIASLLVAWYGTFLLFLGKEAFRAVLFPLLFLFFIVPLPTYLMDNFIYVLQVGSAWSTALIFDVLGTPNIQEGFIFHLGKVSIEIARECSGIRSTMAMVVTGVLAAHLFLRDPGKKMLLLITILPITVFKNGIRIVILTLLAIHVDERFLTGGFLHRSGGFLFYIPGLIIFGTVLVLLRRMEKSKVRLTN
jgi:exosortase